MTLQTSAAQHSITWPQRQQPEMLSGVWVEVFRGVCVWSKNGFFALKALFRGGGGPGVRGGAGCLWEAAFWTAHGR